jgi:hypothetical protein
MKVYTGSGTFTDDKTATLEICLPQSVTSPNDDYVFEYVNVSTANNNGLVVFVRRNVDSGADLSGESLHKETQQVTLNTVAPCSGTAGTASDFDYSKDMLLMVHHESDATNYSDVSMYLFQNLDTIFTTGTVSLTATNYSGPSKTGFGTLKKM